MTMIDARIANLDAKARTLDSWVGAIDERLVEHEGRLESFERIIAGQIGPSIGWFRESVHPRQI
jgi:hypothetical protein